MAHRPCTTFPTHSGDDIIFDGASTNSQYHSTTDNPDISTRVIADGDRTNPSEASHANDKSSISNLSDPLHPQPGHARDEATTANKTRQMHLDDPLIRPLQLPKVIKSRSKDVPYEVSVRHEDPDKYYEPMLYLGNKKSTITVLSRRHPFQNVRVIKKRRVADTNRQPNLTWHLLHDNIAKVCEAFYHNDHIFTVSECLELSLDNLSASPIAIEENHIASIALQVRAASKLLHRLS